MAPYPNWPGSRPEEPVEPAVPVQVVVAPPAPPAPVPVASVIAQPATIQEAIKPLAQGGAGATVGTLLTAPLAPSKGPIDAPAESLVVVTVKNFFETKTWKAIRAVLLSAVALVVITLGTTFIGVWGKGQSVFAPGAIDWRATEIACEISAGGCIVAAVMAWAKKIDNNPSQ